MASLISSSSCVYAQFRIADCANCEEWAMVSIVCAPPHELALLARVVFGLMAEREFAFSTRELAFFLMRTRVVSYELRPLLLTSISHKGFPYMVRKKNECYFCN